LALKANFSEFFFPKFFPQYFVQVFVSSFFLIYSSTNKLNLELCYNLDIVIKLTQIKQVPNNSLIKFFYSKISFIVIIWLLLLLSVSPNLITLSSLDCLNLLTPTKTYCSYCNVNCSIWKDRKNLKAIAFNGCNKHVEILKVISFVSLRLVHIKRCILHYKIVLVIS